MSERTGPAPPLMLSHGAYKARQRMSSKQSVVRVARSVTFYIKYYLALASGSSARLTYIFFEKGAAAGQTDLLCLQRCIYV